MRRIIEFNNVIEVFQDRVQKLSDKPFLWERIHSGWKSISWKEGWDYVLNFASALKERGLQKGDGVSILSANRKEWPLCDLGTIVSGGITVGLYPTSSNVQCQYMINHSESKFVIVDTEEQLKKIMSVRKDLYKVKDIIIIDSNAPSQSKENIWNIADFIRLGKDNRHKYLSDLEEFIKKSQKEDIIIYVYTSGTTGDPKAAMLSNRYVLYNSDSINQIFQFSHEDKILSFLPYCHVGERIFGLGSTLASGRQTFMVPNFNDLFQCVLEVNPTIFGGVPRIYEKMHSILIHYIKGLPLDIQNDIYKGRDATLRYYEHKMKGEKPLEEIEKKYQEYYNKYFKNLIEMVLGKNIKVCTSGAAALNRQISRDFLSIGLIIYEAYGLTENICVSFNRPEKFKIGTVGVPMPHTELKLSEEGEIMVKGMNLFSGYYKNEEATREMFDSDREWMFTGDIGEIDEDGFLKIVDRKKEILVTSTGKNIAPTHIENLLKTNPLISNAMIVGDGKSYISAFITINPSVVIKKFLNDLKNISEEVLNNFMRGEPISINIYEFLSENLSVKKEIENFINEINQQLNRTEQIKKFLILPFDFSIERNEITPTLKLKRKVIINKYSHFINQLYQEESK